MSLFLGVSELPREVGESLPFNLSGEAPVPKAGDEVAFGPVSVSGKAIWTGETVLIEGRAKAQARLTCSRCLRPFERDIEAELSVEFRPEAEDHAGGTRRGRKARRQVEETPEDPKGRDVEFGELPETFGGDSIDLSFSAWEALALELPMKPVCSETCRGLCPVCGANLNEDDCGCRAEDADPRLSALAKLLEAKKQEE